MAGGLTLRPVAGGDLVDLVGIEPTTSSMPWNSEICKLLTAKEILAGTTGKTGPICYQCYQIATKFL
jgi:hypothetical protein